jgi:hypothetical protein
MKEEEVLRKCKPSGGVKEIKMKFQKCILCEALYPLVTALKKSKLRGNV